MYFLVEEPHVTVAIAEAYLAYPRFHDLYDALTWRLTRDPYPLEALQIAPDTYLVKSVNWDYPGFCVITLIYTVSLSHVCVEDFRVDPLPNK